MLKKKTSKTSPASTDSLLIELLTEELPPKSLKRLSEAFETNLYDFLSGDKLLASGSKSVVFATPRRLAVRFTEVLTKQADAESSRRGPKVGSPQQAVEGFARGLGVPVEKLEIREGYYCRTVKVRGEPATKIIPEIVNRALKALPIPKTMRWGAGEAQFVRPVHGVILLHGNKVVPGTVLGLKSGNKTRGHRFLSKGLITIKQARDYEKILKQSGKVFASFDARRETIVKALDAAAKKLDASWNLGKGEELVGEVTSLVEYPVVLAGGFDPAFLEVPKECLVISMQQHQKYFPLADKEGKLLPRFLFVSNMKAANPKEIVHGNERVLRARLSDARFFYDQDRKQRLADRLPRLGNVVYHNKLGSQLERVQRLEKLAGRIAQLLKADRAHAERAAQLCKADLLTEMVGEFPELQGIMGRYYAKYDHEPTVVADAVEQHYWPRTAGGELPKQPIAVCVALADKLDTLVGIYGIGLVPTGEKDPFGLRRAALGVVRILVEKSLALDVKDLLTGARSQFPNGVIADTVVQDLHGFMLERLKPYLKEKGFEPDEIDAVVSLNPARLDQVLPRLKALKEFRALPEGQALAAANKRIRNILRQAGGTPSDKVDAGKLAEPAERKLAEAVQTLEAQVAPLFRTGNYAGAMKHLAGLRPAVDEFFDKVMVMVDDSAVRDNRLALLNRLGNLFLNVADISRLQG
jgi:glycyl-tRNA synthetase beta chain